MSSNKQKNISENLKIRFATKNDVSTILQFIKIFAEHSSKINELTATEELLEQSLFGKDSHAEVILAFEDTRPIGYALFTYNFSTLLGKTGLYLVDIFVLPEFRRQGIGRKMFSYLARLVVERDYGRLEWSVLKTNQQAINLYERMGGVALDDWKTYRISGQSLTTLSFNE